MCGADRHLDLSTASLPASAKPHSTIGHLIVKSLSHSWAPHHHEGAAHHKFPNRWRMRRIFLTPTIGELSQTLRMVAKLQRKSRSKSPARPV